jgi:alpha-galactosidase
MIQYNEQKYIWIIETENTAYVLGISETNTINHIYFGERLPYHSDYPGGANEREWASFTGGEGRSKQEYMSWSGPKYSEPCLKATFHDHVREVDLRYKSYESKENTLSILLEDVHYPLEVLLQYHVIED